MKKLDGNNMQTDEENANIIQHQHFNRIFNADPLQWTYRKITWTNRTATDENWPCRTFDNGRTRDANHESQLIVKKLQENEDTRSIQGDIDGIKENTFENPMQRIRRKDRPRQQMAQSPDKMLTQEGRHIWSKQVASYMSQGHECEIDDRHHECTTIQVIQKHGVKMKLRSQPVLGCLDGLYYTR